LSYFISAECNYITYNTYLYGKERELSIVKNNRERIRMKEEEEEGRQMNISSRE
jgi:hypothetical protein